MEINHLLSAILRQPWVIDANYAASQLPTIIRLLEGQPMVFEDDDDKPKPEPEIIEFQTGSTVIPIYTKSRKWESFADAPKGSIARIPVQDVLTKFDYCGSPGTMSLAQFIREADESPNVIGIYLDYDCPGGQVSGIQTFANAIASARKPIISHGREGIIASGGYWSGCKADKLYTSFNTDQVGSIGTIFSFRDYQGYYEKMGIKVHEIYSTYSTEKNGKIRAFLDDGDDKPIIADLDRITELFIKEVKSARQINVSYKDPFKGAMFESVEAEKIGLIDGIRTQEEVFQEIYDMSKQTKTEIYV